MNITFWNSPIPNREKVSGIKAAMGMLRPTITSGANRAFHPREAAAEDAHGHAHDDRQPEPQHDAPQRDRHVGDQRTLGEEPLEGAPGGGSVIPFGPASAVAGQQSRQLPDRLAGAGEDSSARRSSARLPVRRSTPTTRPRKRARHRAPARIASHGGISARSGANRWGCGAGETPAPQGVAASPAGAGLPAACG